MSHVYKKVAPPTAPRPGSFSFVAAVKEWGDEWKLGVPFRYAEGLYSDCRTPDAVDASRMRLMERGSLPRVDIVLAASEACK